MKKQLFSLVMMLALVVIAGSSAWAQGTGEGTLDDPNFEFAGSTRTFSLTSSTPSSGSTSWQVYTTTATYEADAAATTAVCDPVSGTGTSFTTQWTADATGRYIVRVTEETSNSCTTIRDFHVLIADFDVYVYACDIDGTIIPSSGTLASCGINGSYNPFDNELAGKTGNNPDADGSLDNFEGTDPYSVRYVAVEISSDNIDLSTLAYYWQFDFTITDDTNTDYVSTATRTAGTTVSGNNVIVQPDASSMRTKVVLDLSFYARWGVNIDFGVNIASANTRLSANGTDYTAGNEPSWNYSATPYDDDPYSNQSATQTIWGSPATSIISVN